MTTTTAQPAAAQPPADPGDGSVTSARLRAIVAELNARYLERATAVKAIVACMLAGEHSLLLGPPGTAKSELARDLTSRIQNACLWEVLLSKYTDPKQLFGPIDVAALMQGRYEQVWDGRATKANIAFIDEIGKCGPAALNGMLAYLNERLYHPEAGGAPIRCPLLSAICASNELLQGQESAAIYDRLLVRIEVGYLADVANFATLIRSATVPASPPTAPTTVLLGDVEQAVRVHVPRIDVPDPVIDAVCALRTALHHEGLIASDRRWKKSIRLLQAAAFLDGRNAVNSNDMALLTHVLWDSPADKLTVEGHVLGLVNPDAKEALDLLDGIDAIEAELNKLKGKSREELAEWGIKEANPKLSRSANKLRELLKDATAAGRSTDSIDEVIARHRAVNGRVMVEALNMQPTGI
ncbi:AAA family ATPase [Nonomuraea fuscirosea]|uniref:AAA family ATPase n=1 Tax=Nonomuraea fuscirosea TaxID=1291556 RepID=UPI0033DDEFF0